MGFRFCLGTGIGTLFLFEFMLGFHSLFFRVLSVVESWCRGVRFRLVSLGVQVLKVFMLSLQFQLKRASVDFTRFSGLNKVGFYAVLAH